VEKGEGISVGKEERVKGGERGKGLELGKGNEGLNVWKRGKGGYRERDWIGKMGRIKGKRGDRVRGGEKGV
jgi:hypothetical protein